MIVGEAAVRNLDQARSTFSLSETVWQLGFAIWAKGTQAHRAAGVTIATATAMLGLAPFPNQRNLGRTEPAGSISRWRSAFGY
jgi:hypothetical protein